MFFLCQTCDRWCKAPKEFDEREHFVKCSCGQKMYATAGTPDEYALRVKNEIQGTVIKQ